MNGSQITDSPIGIILLVLGSAVALAALISVIIQIYKDHISDKSMKHEIFGTDKPTKHKSVPKKLKALEERFRELDIPPVVSFTGKQYSEHFMLSVQRVLCFYVCSHTVGGRTLDKKLFIDPKKARCYIFREVMDQVLNSYGEDGFKLYISKLTDGEKAILGV